MLFFTLLSLIFSIHSAECGSDPFERESENRIRVDTGMVASAASGVRFLLEAEYYHEQRSIIDNVWPKSWKRYFWVQSRMEVARDAQGLQIPYLEFKLTPAEEEILAIPALFNTRVLTSEFRRDIQQGVNWGLTLRPIGFEIGMDIGREDRNLESQMDWLVRLTIDTLGFHYMSMANSHQFFGAELFNLQLDAGWEWDFSRHFGVRVQLQTLFRYSIGVLDGQFKKAISNVLRAEAAVQVEFVLKTVGEALVRGSALIRAGVRGQDLSAAFGLPRYNGGEGFLQFGVSLRF